MRRLRTNEFVPFAPDHIGVVRVNHVSDFCHGDSDSMIIERKEDGTITAHCFRCASGGYHRGVVHHGAANAYREFSKRRNAEDANEGDYVVGDLIVGGLAIPTDAKEQPFPADVHAWLNKAGISSVTLDREQFLFSESRDVLYIPVRQLDKLVGYVLRAFKPDLKPIDRYRTLTLDKSRFFGYYPKALDNPTKSVVLVEDVLSGLRVREIADTIVLLGTNLRAAAISLILSKHYEEAIVFLDGDNPTVKREARRVVKHLPFLSTRIIETGSDPKYYSNEQLEKLLT